MSLSSATVTGIGERARAARLRPLAAQRAFGLLLDTLARPGTIAHLDVPPSVPAALLPAATLADVEVTLAVLDDGGWAEAVYAATGSPRAELPDADIVLTLRRITADEVASLRRGSAEAPERGARLVAAVDALHTGDGALRLSFTGPGVPGRREVTVDGLDPAVVAALAAANAEFPAGIDVHLVAADGALVSIPRSTSIRIDHDTTDEGQVR